MSQAPPTVFQRAYNIQQNRKIKTPTIKKASVQQRITKIATFRKIECFLMPKMLYLTSEN
jgi:hypothetical protein